MVFTPKDNLIKKLKQNGFSLQESPAGLTVYSKEFTRKLIYFTLRQTIFEKCIVMLNEKTNGVSRTTHKYNEVDDVNVNGM